MLGMLFYLGGCFVVSALLTFMFVITKPIHARDEMRSWRTWIFMFLLTFLGPYGWTEYLTRANGDKLKAAVEDGLFSANIGGDMRYFRVVKFSEKEAKVIAVSKEPSDWGGTERPVVSMTIVPGKKSWELDSFKVVNSDSRNADGWTFPPFY